MSGIAAGYGRPKKVELEAVMAKMVHRGPCLSGIYENNGAIVAQNYLEADGVIGVSPGQIPYHDVENPGLVIVYDGQMGNWFDLAPKYNIAEGPFREERLLLALYKEHGRDMLQYLGDTIFAFIILDGQDMLVARDLLGIKTLFYGYRDGTLYFATELKGLMVVTDCVNEFPNGYYMDGNGDLTRFASLPDSMPEPWHFSIEKMSQDIRDIIERSFRNRVDFNLATGGLLSGGMDSSVINYIGSKIIKEKRGDKTQLKTFALGVGESSDIHAARIVAEQVGTEHQELIVDLEELLSVLPDVIYYLENFDPSLVRSSASNYLISRYAREAGIEVLLSGEGGDEVFCGYKYLGECPADELFTGQMECIGYLHNNASLRLDRMNQSNSVRVVAPLISNELLEYSLRIPPHYKQKPQKGKPNIEKWIFRKAYEDVLPKSVVWRSKQEFSQGSGSANVLSSHFETKITDNELAAVRADYPLVRSKEEAYYFRLFTEIFGKDKAIATVGQWPFL